MSDPQIFINAGDASPEDRALMIRETSRIRRWEAVLKSFAFTAVTVSALATFAFTCHVICGG